ncbi:hypothetical protein OCH239_16235 [Roseivivax halodurans JCM 10272]|uniref:5-bromo-4-chloroindolyl phosphate hydrolysis protein n=1 Tax=Roseivivax halodurans JCM 10272 TaxID=1449350 RepID=X7EH28_9RHOB|nr:hypothetical protein [Roseivivax halodurans]ETX15374.1 hypothetical protein OCH239_16235 [Roseivivax halodurans JCM 10272]
MKGTRSTRRTVRKGAENLPLLMLAALPMLLWVFEGSLLALLGALFQLSLLAGAILLIAQGQEAQEAYDAAKAARRPALPKKLIGTALIGVLIFLLAATRFTDILPPIMLGIAAMLFSLAAFGSDPLRDKGLDDPTYLAERRAESLMTRADAALRDVVTRVSALGDAQIQARTEAIHGVSMRLLRALGSDPRRLIELEKPLVRFLALVENEAFRLENGWRDSPERSARFYVTRLEALSVAFESGARQRRSRETPDVYALDTDLLVERMQREATV